MWTWLGARSKIIAARVEVLLRISRRNPENRLVRAQLLLTNLYRWSFSNQQRSRYLFKSHILVNNTILQSYIHGFLFGNA